MKYICYEMHFVMMNVRNAVVLHVDLLVEMIVGPSGRKPLLSPPKKTGSKTDNLFYFILSIATHFKCTPRSEWANVRKVQLAKAGKPWNTSSLRAFHAIQW